LSQLSGPIGLAVRGSGTQAAQALELRLDFTLVKVAIPETTAKAAGAPMTVTAHIKGAAASGGAVRFDARIDLQGADLRPGGSIDKAPGQRLDLALDGTRKGERHLDLDKMLIPSKTEEKEKEKEKTLDPKAFAGLSGHAAVKIDRLRMRKQELTAIVADVTMNEDDLKVNTAQLKAFGGTATGQRHRGVSRAP
jgi:AsmA protein